MGAGRVCSEVGSFCLIYVQPGTCETLLGLLEYLPNAGRGGADQKEVVSEYEVVDLSGTEPTSFTSVVPLVSSRFQGLAEGSYEVEPGLRGTLLCALG